MSTAFFIKFFLKKSKALLCSVICFLECVLASLSIIKFIVGALTSSNTLVVVLIPSPWVFLYIQKCPWVKKGAFESEGLSGSPKNRSLKTICTSIKHCEKTKQKIIAAKLCNKVEPFTFSRRRTTIIFAIYGEIKVTLCCHVFCFFFFWPSNWGNGVAL